MKENKEKTENRQVYLLQLEWATMPQLGEAPLNGWGALAQWRNGGEGG